MNNIISLTEYKVKKLTKECITFKGDREQYTNLLRDIMDAKKEIEKND